MTLEQDLVSRLVRSLRDTADALEARGVETMRRAQDWTHRGQMPVAGERGGGYGDHGEPEHRAADRREAYQASQYIAELATLSKRLSKDGARIRAIIAICCPEPVRSLLPTEMQRVQLAADGYCVSCWRAGEVREIETDKHGHRYYKDRCRSCGEYRAANGEDQPLEHLIARHEGRRVRVKAFNDALTYMALDAWHDRASE